MELDIFSKTINTKFHIKRKTLSSSRMQRLARVIALSFACVFFVSSAWAIDGRTAVGMCIDSTASGARCVWAVNDKGEIDICNKNGCVTCPSATEECTIANIRPRPTSSLPEGAEIKTELGSFKIQGSNRIDKLIKPKEVKRP